MKTFADSFNEKQQALARPRLEKVADWYIKGLGPTEIGKLLDVDRRRAWQLIQQAKKFGLIPKVPVP